MTIKFGPAGLGGVKDAISNLEMYHELGLKACEIAFTYGIYIKKKEDALKIGKAAKKLGIKLSIHAPYWINLNSKDKGKIEKSKERILQCCEVGTYLNASKVVFHPGYYNGFEKEKSYKNIKKAILEIQKIRKEKKFTPKLAPETTGKKNVFGDIDEISQLVKDTKCNFCIDFAHILAKYKNYEFEKIKKQFIQYDDWHVHFSGIEYGEKGEKKHILTSENEFEKIIKFLLKQKKVVIINESPNPVKDSVMGLKIYEKL